jgi:hypothetical protein
MIIVFRTLFHNTRIIIYRLHYYFCRAVFVHVVYAYMHSIHTVHRTYSSGAYCILAAAYCLLGLLVCLTVVRRYGAVRCTVYGAVVVLCVVLYAVWCSML